MTKEQRATRNLAFRLSHPDYFREWRERNREKINARRRERRCIEPAIRQRESAKHKAYRSVEANRDKERAGSAKYREKNGPALNAKCSAWYQANAESERAKARVRSAQYRIDKPEQARAAVRRWCAENPDRLSAIKLAYYLANPERFKVANDKRLMLQCQASDGTLTVELLRSMYAEAVACSYCSVLLTSQNKSLDHLDPLSLGGAHSVTNVAFVCISCNKRKHNKPLAAWVAKLSEQNRAITLAMVAGIRARAVA